MKPETDFVSCFVEEFNEVVTKFYKDTGVFVSKVSFECVARTSVRGAPDGLLLTNTNVSFLDYDQSRL